MTPSVRHLAGLARRSAERWPSRIALEDASGDRSVTYEALWRRAERGASALVGLGLSPGDRVLLVCKGSPDWLASLLAIVRADLVAVPLPDTVPAELVRLAAMHVGARATISDASGAVGEAPIVLTPAELFAANAGAIGPPRAAGSDTAVLAFTSGSTDRPRVVVLSHDNLLANLRSLVAARRARDDEALLSVLPPAHLYELVAGQLGPLAVGARVVYGGSPLPNRLVDALGPRRITRVALVPALLDAMARELLDGLIDGRIVDPAWRGQPVADLAAALDGLSAVALARLVDAVRARIGRSLDTLAVGGAAVSPAWARILGTFGIGIDVGYGLTEAGPLVSVGQAGDCPAGSVGQPLPGVEVRISDAGEILVRSASVMAGYYRDDRRSAEAIENGWLRTGDRGHVDASGFLFVSGRIKEAIVTAAGETVYPEDIEPYYGSPCFDEHCVVPRRVEDGNDEPTLVVVPRPDVGEAAVRDALAACRAAAPARCRIQSFVIRRAPLPRTAVGKIRRRVLAEAIEPAEVRA